MAEHSIKKQTILDARALAMVDSRIRGRSLAQIADEFGVSVKTVERSLTRAEKFDLAARYEDYLIGRLGALAIGAYETALLDGDTAVATKVLESIGLIRKPTERPNPEGEGEETWEAYLKVRKKRGTDEQTGNAPSIESRGDGGSSGILVTEIGAVDGEVLGDERLSDGKEAPDEPHSSEDVG